MILMNEKEEDFIQPLPVKLHGEILIPGTFTTLDGQFNKPIRYAGIHNWDGSNMMCFHAGGVSDLFETVEYYYCYIWLNENRIVNSYKFGTARDFHWRNDHWH